LKAKEISKIKDYKWERKREESQCCSHSATTVTRSS